MALNTLSLPIDIPWKRLCVSSDMIDEKVCDREFPYRWRSSVAVFSYEPSEDHQTYDDAIVSYLKVVCTITGLQAGEEVQRKLGLPPDPKKYFFNDPTVTQMALDVINSYYGCFGAILEVSIKPNGDIPISKYPYFIDFEPKKREIYELVSETGEVMSRSLDEVNIQKGATTTASTEVLDKSSFGFEFKPEFATAKIGGLSGGNEKSIKNINQTEHTDVRTTDRSREMRELFSHTTQLTQMYHQFTSYHLGTNRAVFFIVPRPHIVESEHTFVDGPRALEGIQEVLLVVMRQKDIPQFCVEAYLETAHIAFEHKERPKKEDNWPWKIDHVEAFDDVGASEVKEFVWPYTIPAGWEIDYENESGLKVEALPYTKEDDVKLSDPPLYGYWIDASETNKANIVVRLGAADTTIHYHNKYIFWLADLRLTVYLRKAEEEARDIPQTLFITGRGVCCCPPATDRPEKTELVGTAVLIEKPVKHGERLIRRPSGMSIKHANRLRNEIGKMMVQSVNDPHRYPRGTVSILETQFLARSIAQQIDRQDHPDNHLIQEIAGLKREVRDKISAVMPRLRRADLLRMQIQETRDRFGINEEESRHLRRAALGLEGPKPEPKDRWDPPGRRIEQSVPNVIGLSLDQAKRMLKQKNMSIGIITYQDSEQPTDVVLSQDPGAGGAARAGTEINIVLATGLTICIPDIVGKPLSEALCLLRDSGLQSEPELDFVASREHPKHHVLEVNPKSRRYITPHATLVLRISQ